MRISVELILFPLKAVSAVITMKMKNIIFLNCWLYDIQRQQLLQKLNFIPVITTDLLLYGSTQVIVLK